MAKIKGICSNEECELCDEIQEVEKSNFVCEKCGKPLMPFGGTAKNSWMKAHGKQVGIIAGAAVVLIGGGLAVASLTGGKDDAPKTIKLNHITCTLNVGDKDTLKVTNLPEGSTALFSTQANDNLTVDDNGIVTADKAGEGKVSVTLEGNDNIQAICTYTVIEAENEAEITEVEAGNEAELIALQPTSITLKAGGTTKLKPQLNPSDATASINWTSDNSKIASVSSDGTVTAINHGTTIIKATLADKTVTATVIVKDGKTTQPSGPRIPYGKYDGPANGMGGTIYVTRSYSLDLNEGSGEAIYLQPGDQIQNTKFQGGQLRSGVWIHNGSRRFFNR